MPRASREQTKLNRDAVVKAASDLLSQDGVAATTVDRVSAQAGVTHGSFYKQFESKDALLAEAMESAADRRREVLRGRVSSSPDDGHFFDWYLSNEHRDQGADSCPAASLVGDVARDPSGPLSKGYTAAVTDLMQAVRMSGASFNRQEGVVSVALMVGALELARATRGSTFSDEVLEAARAHFDHFA